MSYHFISPPTYVFTGEGDDEKAITVYGWYEIGGRIQPIVGNPDGPGIGVWAIYYGEDEWHIP